MPPRIIPATALKHAIFYTVPAALAYYFFLPAKGEVQRAREIEFKYKDKVDRARAQNKQIFKFMREQNSPESQKQFDDLLKAGKSDDTKRKLRRRTGFKEL